MSNPIRERFCQETGFSNVEARQLTRKAALAMAANEHECNGDPHPDANDDMDKNECAKLWGYRLCKITEEMVMIAERKGYTVEYAGLRPCLRKRGHYVEIPHE